MGIGGGDVDAVFGCGRGVGYAVGWGGPREVGVLRWWLKGINWGAGG